MRVVVTGSIASDYLMSFNGRFTEQLLPEALHRVSLSFLVDDLVVRRGGVAANICFGMAQLGHQPVLVGAVGGDFDEYRSWLDRHGIDTKSVHVSDVHYTARFFCTTDLDDNQIASFYTGAMSEARNIELAPVARRLGGIDLAVISPNDPEAMRRHTEEARQLGIPFMADPSQQLARIDGEEIVELVSGARYLVANDYELALIQSKTGWSLDELLGRVGTAVITHGAKGCVVDRAGEPTVKVDAVPEVEKADPTGVGDAFRAGFLTGQAWGLSLERSAQVGSLLATYVLETVGTQEYVVQPRQFVERLRACFGDAAGDDVAARACAG